MIVILGTAHGSNVSGKQSPDGKLKEYKWSRNMCKRIQEKLCMYGIESIIDIEEDTEKSVTARVNLVNQLCDKYDNDCIYISIHVDAAKMDGKWYNASGWTVRVGTKASQNSKKLALCLFEEAEKENLCGNRCIPDTKWFAQNLAVCNNTRCPAVLTENMFQDNKDDVKFLLSEEGCEQISNVHVNGILKYIELKNAGN